MTKQKKKRTKRYQGEDATAASSQPVVHHFQAVDRSRAGQWWFEKKKAIGLGTKITLGVGVFAWLLFELFRLVF